MTALTIGRAIREIREGRGLNRQQLADLTGVQRSMISRWELGRRLPDLASVRLLVRHVALTDEELSLLASGALLAEGDRASVERRGGSLVVRRKEQATI